MSVRRCAACGQPAMIPVRGWDLSTSMYGVLSSTKKGGGGVDFVCQGCGAGFTQPARSLLGWVMFPLGVLFVLLGAALSGAGVLSLSPWLLGVGLLALAFGGFVVRTPLLPLWQRYRYPVVPDAPVPPLRFRGEEPRRRCDCGQAARCSRVTANRINGVYTGTEYEFVCDACERRFTIASPMETVSTVGGGLFLTFVAWVLLPDAGAALSAWAIPAGVALLGLFMVGVGGRTGLARRKHPVVVGGGAAGP